MGGTKTSEAGSALEHGFRFGEFAVKPLAGLVSGPAGPTQVDPKVMDVLVVLAQRAQEVVPREELLDEVWPGVVVSDDVLSRCIYQLRRHLSQAGGSDRHRMLVETVPKRGYRLNCAVAATTSEPTNEASSRLRPGARTRPALSTSSWVVALAALAAAATFSGVAFWVAERARLPDPPPTNALAHDAYVRASDYFGRSDRQTALPYAVQLYQQAVNLDPSFALALVGLARAHTDMYWHGIDRTPSRLERAESALYRLFALDPDLPEARLAKANYLLKGLNRYEEAVTELEEAAKRLPRDPELFFLRAMAYRRLGEWDRAIESLDAALELDSTNILYLRQQYISHQFVREYEQAEDLLNRIVELYPDDGTAYVDMLVLALCRDGDATLADQFEASPPSEFYDEGLAHLYTSWLAAIYERNYDKALRILDGSAEDPIFDGDLRNTSFGPKALFYARTHQLAGNARAAREQFSEVVRLIEERLSDGVEDDSRSAAARHLALAEAHAGLGQREHAWDSIQRVRMLASETQDSLSSTAIQIASVIRVLIPAGYEEQALRELDNYLGNRVGHWSIEGIRNDPRLGPLRNSAGFRYLEEKYSRQRLTSRSSR